MNPIVTQKTCLIEIIGPAGAGKTTLSQVLRQRNKDISMGPDIELRKISQFPVFFRNALIVVPFLFDWRLGSRWFHWDEIKSIVYLKGWDRILRQPTMNSTAFILLDQGPVFRLA